MASRDPSLLSFAMRDLYARFKLGMQYAGIDFLVTCTYRSNGEQDMLYAQGRTAPGRIVTEARGGQSAHNVLLNSEPSAEAFDIVLLDSGKCIWNSRDRRWTEAGNISKNVGLEWAGLWPHFPEFPHFQNPKWKASK